MDLDDSTYPKFDPVLHLIKPSNENITVKIDIFKENFLSDKCKLYLEQTNDFNSYPVFTLECIKIINWEINSWFNSFKISSNLNNLNNLKIFNNNIINFEILKYLHNLPFLFNALTNNETLNLLSSYLGFEINPILNYEFAHIASKRGNFKNFKNIKFNKNNLNSKFIIRDKSVAYPFICLIKLNKNQLSDNFKLGYCILLKGRLIENLACKLILKNNSNFQSILCPTYVPKQVKNFEDMKDLCTFNSKNDKSNQAKISKKSHCQTKNDILSKKCTSSNTSNVQNLQKIEKYKYWLNNYFKDSIKK